jgi:hypothetical protein
MVAVNSMYLLARARGDDLRLPATGQYQFKLESSEAWMVDIGRQTRTAAAVQRGDLSVNFGAQTFATSLDVLANNASYALRAQGRVGSDGLLTGNMLYGDLVTNTNVRGALGGREGEQASYLFDHSIDVLRSIVGAAAWRR